MLFGIDINELPLQGKCENIWRSKRLFVYLQGKYDDIFTV
jgi:hypothetical protein